MTTYFPSGIPSSKSHITRKAFIGHFNNSSFPGITSKNTQSAYSIIQRVHSMELTVIAILEAHLLQLILVFFCIHDQGRGIAPKCNLELLIKAATEK